MSTRQLRLQHREKIEEHLPRLLGKTIHVVLGDRTAHVVTLKSHSATEVVVMNLRKKLSNIPINTITEIYYDTTE